MLAALRSTLRRFERSRFGAAAVGADLATWLPGRRYWLPAADAGLLAVDGAAVRLTAAGLAAVGTCSACRWASCRGGCARRPEITPRTVGEAPKIAPSGDHPQRRVLEVAAADLSIVLERLPAAAGTSLRGVRGRVLEVYRRRAHKALLLALRRWSLCHLGCAPGPGIDLAPLIAGKRRYWETGGSEGWLSISGTAGRSGDPGARKGCRAVLTAAGLAAVRG